MSSYHARSRRHLASSPFNSAEPAPSSEPERYAVNDRVTHDRYGLGTIVAVEDGFGVVVDFGSHKQRLRTPCAKLVKL